MAKKPPPKPSSKPRRLRCIAHERGVVVESLLEPQATAPDVMRWGERIFVFAEVQPKPDKLINYREATVRRIPKKKPTPIFFDKQPTHSVATNLEPGGLHMHFDCRTCGRPRQLIATYPELMSCLYGVPPQVAFGPLVGKWAYNATDGCWVPINKCPSCPDNLQPSVSLQEIEVILAHARGSGWLPPQIEQQIKRRVALRRRQARRRVKNAATARRIPKFHKRTT